VTGTERADPEGRRWRVELSREAERGLRALADPVRRRVGEALDALEREGLPPAARPHPALERTHTVAVGDHTLLVTARPDRKLFLVARIAPGEADARRALASALPGPGRVWARLAGWASDLATDLRFALRMFRRSPGITVAVLLTLGLGIGGTSSVFGAFHTVYRAALPFEDGERLVRIRSYSVTPEGEQRVYNFPPRDAVAVRERNRTLTGVVAMDGGSLALPTGEGSPERVSAVGVTEGWTELLGVEPRVGRTFTRDEAIAGRDAGVALVAHSLWERRFGGDPGAVGRTLPVEGGDLTVIGVMPPRFNYPYDAEIWTPVRLDPTDFRSHDLNVVGRMRPGVELEAVRADLARIYRNLEEESPGTARADGIHVATSRQDFIRDDGRIVQALLVAVAFFLLLACVNVANLLTAHFVSRRREIGIRAALGAGGGRQLRQFVTETLLLFLAGGALGLLLTGWLGDSLLVLLPNVLRDQLDLGSIGVNGPVLAFGLGVAALAGLLSGIAAAQRASSTDLRGVLHEGSRGASRGGGRFQDGLVVTELALSVVLLLGAGVMFDHFQRLRGQDLGFEPEGVHTLQVTLEGPRYAGVQERWQLVRALEERLGAEPGVEGVGVTSVNPLCCGDWGAAVEIEGRPVPPDGTPLHIHHRYVTPGYFETMGIPVLRGRVFPGADRPEGPLEVMVDASMARRQWPGEDPVGKRVRLHREGAEWRTVVGVVGAIEAEGDYEQGWYLPFYREPTNRSNEILHLMVRLRSDEALAGVREAVREVAPALPVFGVAAMEDLRRETLSQDRLGALMTAVFAAFGLLLATVGLYSLMAYGVSLRRREIGTRIALGASRKGVLGLVMRQAGVLVAVGGVAGVGLALLLNRVLRSMVLGVRMAGPEMVLPLLGILLLVAGGAVLVPAIRAARVDPVRAFRAE